MDELQLSSMKNRSNDRIAKMKKSKHGIKNDTFFDTYAMDQPNRTSINGFLFTLIKCGIFIVLSYNFFSVIGLIVASITSVLILSFKPLMSLMFKHRSQDDTLDGEDY